MVSIPQKEKIQNRLLRWFERHGRDLPWRRTRDPYAIWVSEIMLQQTQVPTVIPYYQRFLKSFPTVRHLAKTDLSGVLKIWEGLGYYSRARNLHRASQMVAQQFHGKMPGTLEDLLRLPGIGRYTAGAILSIAFNKEAPILDGNVKRVLSRIFALPEDSQTEQLLWETSESLIPKGRASAFNQAMMDLGATLCTPKDPRCLLCPLRDLCKALASGHPENYPAKAARKAIPHIEAIAAVIRKDGKVFLRQRPPEGLLGGLWEFPNWRIEEKRMARLGLRLRNDIKKEVGFNVRVKKSMGPFQQIYSHFKLTLHVYCCQATGNGKKGKWIPIEDLDQLAMSRIHRRIAHSISDLGSQNAD